MPEAWHRSDTFSRGLLEHVVRSAGIHGPAGERFAAEVTERMSKGAREYGGDDRYLERGAQIFDEIAEELEDVAGWGELGLLITHLLEAQGLDADTAAWVRKQVLEVIVASAALWGQLDQVREVLAA